MQKTINVTQHDITDGLQHDLQSCPVALAISRHSKVNPLVTGAYVDFGSMYRFQLPGNVYAKIVNYDRGNGMQPFKSKLDIPNDYLKRMINASS